MDLTQYRPSPGVIDLSWGHPDPSLLPIQQLQAATVRALDRYGPDMLGYGNPAGPPPLIEFICERLALTDARAPTAAEVVVTSGASQGLDLAATFLLEPGDTVLVDVPTYHLAVRILRDYPIVLAGVRSDDGGIVLEDLARTITQLRAEGRAPKLLYTIPTFHNPTGRTLSEDRRAGLLALAAQEGLLIVEDDTYRELSYDGPAPASLWASDTASSVVRLGSFAKSVSPGLRVGFVTASPEIAERMVASGLYDSGGGPTHYAALTLAEYAAAGDFARQVERFKAAYRAQRDSLLASLAENLPAAASWSRPGGGYFTWVQLPEGIDARALLPFATSAGIGFLPADVFFLDPDDAPNAIRLAFSMHPPEVLAEAGARLGSAIEGAAP